MYESPISLVEQIADKVREETDNCLVEYVRKIGFNVNKYELERALLYDRRQYEKGYNEGYQDGRASAAEWVPCAIGLPEPDVRVLCLTQTKAGRTNYVIGYHDGQRWVCGMNSNVIAWMPLPEPPRFDRVIDVFEKPDERVAVEGYRLTLTHFMDCRDGERNLIEDPITVQAFYDRSSQMPASYCVNEMLERLKHEILRRI